MLGQVRSQDAFRMTSDGAFLLTDRLARLFLDMIAAERGAARNTLDAYERDLAES